MHINTNKYTLYITLANNNLETPNTVFWGLAEG